MGWDAYAVRSEVDPRRSGESFLTPPLEDVFRRAKTSPWLDGLCMGLLHRATGIPDYAETSDDCGLLWSVETVLKARASAHWDIPLQDHQDPEHLEWTRSFLDICASQGLAIWFSW
jgi:hypothetical protein